MIEFKVILCCAALAVCGQAVMGTPYFQIDSELEWRDAIGSGQIEPMMPAEWSDYMTQWNVFLVEGDPYPSSPFIPPMLPQGDLYVYGGGGGGGGGYPEDAGLVMVWQPTAPGEYASAWKYVYTLDPDLSNATITVTVTAPQWGQNGQINNVSFGIQDANGAIRSWQWLCGPGNPIPWGVPTTITITPAVLGVNASTPVASGFMNNPAFNIVQSIQLIVDENGVWVGGPLPVPPPGTQIPGGLWNYWHNIAVSQQQPAFKISCEGTESTGGGVNNYEYMLINNTAAPILVTVLEVASNDPNMANYTNWTMPAGFLVQLTPNTAYWMAQVKTPHGGMSPGWALIPPVYVQWANPAGVNLPPGGTLGPFGFDHPWTSADAEWMASGMGGVPMTVAQVSSPVAGPIGIYTDGPVHGPYQDQEPSAFLLEFSLDIGSDKELSDPQKDGDEAFDPGDVYAWLSAPVLPPGRNGFKDDGMRIFGQDPPPTPGVPGSGAPVGLVPPSMWLEYYPMYFDLDGHDQIDLNLEEFFLPGGTIPPLIPRLNSACIHDPRHLLVSFDDDQAPGWIAFDVPVTVPSPIGMIYGTTPGQDEVVGVNLMSAGLPPLQSVCMTFPFVDEIGVHQSLMANPDPGNPEDDDVDSLDAVPNKDACPFYYFTADHEATGGLDPGHIYLAMNPGAMKVIDKMIHLGLPPDTDIDGFEFVWLEYPQMPGNQFLAIIFSVDDDDPITPNANESGGLDPRMIYYSFFQGWSAPLLQQPLADDIDAITAWRQNFGPPLSIVSAVSRKVHGSAGSFDAPAGTWEGRVDKNGANPGPTTIITVFNQPIQVTGGTTAVAVSSGIVDSVTVGSGVQNNVLTVVLHGVTSPSVFTITYPGVSSLCDPAKTTTQSSCWAVLAGEADGKTSSGAYTVNAFDLVTVKVAQNVIADPLTFRKDIRADGIVNAFDLVFVKIQQNTTVPVCP